MVEFSVGQTAVVGTQKGVMGVITEQEIQERPNETVYCLHCDGEFKARDLRGSRFGRMCADRNCDGGFLDLCFEPWWRPAHARKAQ